MIKKRVHAVHRLFAMYNGMDDHETPEAETGTTNETTTKVGLDAAALSKMIQGTIQIDVSKDIVFFMNALDKDGNGHVAQSEILAYFLAAMAQNPQKSAAFAARSTFHAQLAEFMHAVLEMSDSKLYT